MAIRIISRQLQGPKPGGKCQVDAILFLRSLRIRYIAYGKKLGDQKTHSDPRWQKLFATAGLEVSQISQTVEVGMTVVVSGL